MKTLNEVIFEAPYSQTPWEADALYHLNKYRMTLDDIVAKRKALEAEIDRYQEAVKNCEEAENYYSKLLHSLGKVGNDPLTWDELKTMAGRPVWVDGSVCSSGFWAIVEGFGKSGEADYVFLCGSQFWKEDMKDADDGVSWQAFRKERE